MAGHSHWAGIKHKKALIDNKRGKVWSKIAKALMVAAKLGGGDPTTNPRLRVPLADARAARMPKDNIERAIKKGTGELDGGDVEEILYEGYGPGGVAILCEIMTDNRNRTAPELRKLFDVHGGKLGATGCVSYLFERKGLVAISATAADEEQLMEIALETGADDVKREDETFEITCDPDVYADLLSALEAAGIEPTVKEVTRIPSSTVDLDVEQGQKVLKFMEALDDHDDVQSVSSNFNVPKELMDA
ncbi:MAG: YebC/PmpR family DNA-binding transcriptional regulator [Planctomycetales bacterium]|nr:YebC/PmpR family DNA-binding transcriptional regulator [Planctomycetales bacterium]MCA9167963.1 YebC/PmpR family DNA-binding transcriptional regulator [Planctomycetales bacterium]